MDLPARFPFLQLLQHAKTHPDRVAVRDLGLGVEASSVQLLHAVVSLRNTLRGFFENTTLTHIRDRFEDSDPRVMKIRDGVEDVLICVLIPPGWDFVVATLAIWGLGAGIIPLSPSVMPEEAKYFISLSKADALLYCSSMSKVADAMRLEFRSSQNWMSTGFRFVQSDMSKPPTILPDPKKYQLVKDVETQPDRAASILFTSGTTGRPKGVLHTHRAITDDYTQEFLASSIPQSRTLLHKVPVHWAAGFNVLFKSITSGNCVEFCSSVFTPAWFWERIKKGDVNEFFFPPDGYSSLTSHFREHIMGLPTRIKQEYIDAITNVASPRVGGAPLPVHTQRFWMELRGGRPLMNGLGTTETMLVMKFPFDRGEEQYAICDDKCSVGHLLSGAKAKILDDGELHVKTPWQFSRYISEDPQATENTLDSDGFFKTGDIAEKQGDHYFILGRASIDTIRFNGWKTLALTIETALLTLPYIESACVFSLPDPACHERVAAILSSSSQPTINLETLRKDLLNTSLEKYKFPTAVYWLAEGEELPRNNGKIVKSEARKLFFEGWEDWGERKGRGEIWDLERKDEQESEGKRRVWDWAGIAAS